MARLRFENVAGTLTSDLEAGSGTFSHPNLARMGAVAAPDIAAITIIKADGTEHEVVHVTAHALGATTASIQRAKEGTSNVAFNAGDIWTHGPTGEDFAELGTQVKVTADTEPPEFVESHATLVADYRPSILVDGDQHDAVFIYCRPSLDQTAGRLSGLRISGAPAGTQPPDEQVGLYLHWDSAVGITTPLCIGVLNHVGVVGGVITEARAFVAEVQQILGTVTKGVAFYLADGKNAATDPWALQLGDYKSQHRGQLAVGGATVDTVPATSASIDLQHTDKALILNRVTTTQRNALTAVEGMVVYNTTTDQVEGYIDSAWRPLVDTGGATFTGTVTLSDGYPAASTDYVDSSAVGLSWKNAVQAASTAALTLASMSDGDTIDGRVVREGDRVLLKNQSAATENGIYEIKNTSIWTAVHGNGVTTDGADIYDGGYYQAERTYDDGGQEWHDNDINKGGSFYGSGTWAVIADPTPRASGNVLSLRTDDTDNDIRAFRWKELRENQEAVISVDCYVPVTPAPLEGAGVFFNFFQVKSRNANNASGSSASSTLNGNVTTTNQTNIPCTNRSLFPAAPFIIKVNSELMAVTATGAGAGDFTVVRGVLGTTATTHSSGNGVSYDPVTTGCALLTEELDASETGVDVSTFSNFPSGSLVVQIDNERMAVTNKSGSTLTVVRAAEGTTAATHTNGTPVCWQLRNDPIWALYGRNDGAGGIKLEMGYGWGTTILPGPWNNSTNQGGSNPYGRWYKPGTYTNNSLDSYGAQTGTQLSLPIGEWFTVRMQISQFSAQKTTNAYTGRVRVWVNDVLYWTFDNVITSYWTTIFGNAWNGDGEWAVCNYHDGTSISPAADCLIYFDNGEIEIPATATRTVDMDAGSEFPGAAVLVSGGTTNANTAWTCTNTTPPTLGATNIGWSQFSGGVPSLGGDLSGTVGNATVAKIGTTPVSGTGSAITVTGKITQTGTPTANGDLATKLYVDTATGNLAGDVTGTLATTNIASIDGTAVAGGGAGGRITATGRFAVSDATTYAPSANTDLTTKKYVDEQTLAGDVTGGLGATNVASIDGTAVAGTGANGRITVTGRVAQTLAPTAGTDLATKNYVDGLTAGTTTSDYVRYVDPVNGDDMNDGKTPAAAKRTVFAAVVSLPKTGSSTTISLAGIVYLMPGVTVENILPIPAMRNLAIIGQPSAGAFTNTFDPVGPTISAGDNTNCDIFSNVARRDGAPANDLPNGGVLTNTWLQAQGLPPNDYWTTCDLSTFDDWAHNLNFKGFSIDGRKQANPGGGHCFNIESWGYVAGITDVRVIRSRKAGIKSGRRFVDFVGVNLGTQYCGTATANVAIDVSENLLTFPNGAPHGLKVGDLVKFRDVTGAHPSVRTRANGAGASSTSLTVDDRSDFPQSGTFKIVIGGDVVATVNADDAGHGTGPGVLKLTSPKTWADNDTVEYGGPMDWGWSTVATADTGSGTSLKVDDASMFPASGRFDIFIEGTAATVTAVNFTTNTLTLQSGVSRSDGDRVTTAITGDYWVQAVPSASTFRIKRHPLHTQPIQMGGSDGTCTLVLPGGLLFESREGAGHIATVLGIQEDDNEFACITYDASGSNTRNNKVHVIGLKSESKDDDEQKTVSSIDTSVGATNGTFTTSTNHSLDNGDLCWLYWSGGTITGDLREWTPYSVINKTANTFQLSETPGGPAIAISAYTATTIKVMDSGGSPYGQRCIAYVSQVNAQNGATFKLDAPNCQTDGAIDADATWQTEDLHPVVGLSDSDTAANGAFANTLVRIDDATVNSGYGALVFDGVLGKWVGAGKSNVGENIRYRGVPGGGSPIVDYRGPVGQATGSGSPTYAMPDGSLYQRSAASGELWLRRGSAWHNQTQLSGSGSPEGVITANVGAQYVRTDGGPGTYLYVKVSGTGNTGWQAV